jgi:iron(III) transport system permease protein
VAEISASSATVIGARRFDPSAPIFALFALLLAALVFLPMGWLAVFSFTDRDGNATLAHFGQLLSDSEMVRPLAVTMIVATSVAILCTLVATPMAWLIARTDMPLRRPIRLLVMASFVTPPFLGAVAWEILAAPNSGLINQLYRLALGFGREARLLDIYTLYGLILAIANYTFPYVFILAANGLDRIPADLEDASSILGASRWRTAARITVPLVLPAILAGTLIAFLQAMNNFGSPAIIALPAGFHTMTTKIWSMFQYPPQPGLAAAAAVPLLAVTVVLLRLQHAMLGRRGYSVVGGKGGQIRLVRLGWLKWLALGYCGLIVGAAVVLPYAALVLTAFARTLTITWSAEGFGLDNFRFIFFEFSSTRLALWNTFVLGASAATAGTIVTLIIAYVTSRRAVPGHRILGMLATAPIAIPGIVFGLGLFFAYTHPPLVIYGTLAILFIAFLTTELPIGYQQFQAAFLGIHIELEEASRILGATRLRALKDVIAPLIGTAVVSTWCFIFIAAIRELSAAVLLYTANTKVLSVVIYDLNENGELGAIAVLGLLMLAVTFAVVGLAAKLPRAAIMPTSA